MDESMNRRTDAGAWKLRQDWKLPTTPEAGYLETP
jgi:hypothetical protein